MLVDTYVLSRLGTECLATAALAGAILGTFVVFGSSSLSSVSVLAAQAHGEGHSDKQSAIFRDALWYSAFLGVVLVCLVYFFGPVYGLLGQHPNILADATRFLTLISWSAIPEMVFLGAKAFSEALGKPLFPMFVQYAAVLMNIVLSIFLGFGLFGLPKFGLYGVGYALLSATSFSAMVAVLYAARLASCGLTSAFFKPDGARLARLLRLARKTHKKASKAAPFFVNSWCSTS